MKRTATCCCGACTLDVEGEPDIHAVCSCSNCKKRTGSAFGISAYFKKEAVTVPTAAMSLYELNVGHPTREQQRFFCASCGTTLYWWYKYFEDKWGVAGGCFIEEPLPTPKYSVHNEEKCPWVTLDSECKEWR